jgi:hypothetical protein
VNAVHRRRAILFLALVALAGVVVLLARGGDDGPRRLSPGQGDAGRTADPLAYDRDKREEFEQRAAAGLAHVLYVKSPGGAVATAERVARWRPLIDEVAAQADLDADTLEAMVFLESAGRPDARASDDPAAATGLTQILAQTATGLLGMKVDVEASRRLTRRIARARSDRQRRRLEQQRARVDERYDPRKALQATARYLNFAKRHLGRDDLAVVSYHMGVGNLQRALDAYGERDIPYAQLFFDSTPLRHAAAWRVLSSLGDDSSTYLWRVLAAKEIMRLHREDPAELRRRAELNAWSSGELMLRPPEATERFEDDDSLNTSNLVLLDEAALPPRQARLSRALAAAPEGRRALRPEAAALLRYLAAGVADIAGTGPLVVTAAARSEEAERADARGASEAAPSTHTTGYAFDIGRSYRSGRQAQAFQFWLDRLQALDLIAWERHADTIHITVGPRAEELVGPLLGKD